MDEDEGDDGPDIIVSAFKYLFFFFKFLYISWAL